MLTFFLTAEYFVVFFMPNYIQNIVMSEQKTLCISACDRFPERCLSLKMEQEKQACEMESLFCSTCERHRTQCKSDSETRSVWRADIDGDGGWGGVGGCQYIAPNKAQKHTVVFFFFLNHFIPEKNHQNIIHPPIYPSIWVVGGWGGGVAPTCHGMRAGGAPLCVCKGVIWWLMF